MKISFDHVLDIAMIKGLDEHQIHDLQSISVNAENDGSIIIEIDQLGEVLSYLAFTIEASITW